MLNIVICDDELQILDQISNLFKKAALKNDINAKVVFTTTDYNELLSYMYSNVVHVVVLDIELKNGQINGLEIASKIREFNKECYLIFATSHFEYIMEAYQYKTFDYIIKNAINLEKISETLFRLQDDMQNASKKFLRIDAKGTFIDLNDIQFIEKRGVKLIYHTSQNVYETYYSFAKLKNKLPSNFVRCHKSYIANVNKISDVSLSDASITFYNGNICYIGPKFKNNFLEGLNHDVIVK